MPTPVTEEVFESAADARRRRLISLTVLVGLGALAAFIQQRGGFELDPRIIRDRIEELGPIAPIAFIFAAAFRPVLLLPSWVVMSAGGLLFGVVGGVLWGSVGFTLGAVLAFALARGLGRDAVRRRLHGRAARFDTALRRRGASWLMLYTAIPITPLTPVHAGAGLSGIRVGVFLLAVVSGFIPRIAMLSFFGDSLNSAFDGELAPAIGALVLLVAASAGGLYWANRIARERDSGEDGIA